MLFFRKKTKTGLERFVSGISFNNPAGYRLGGPYIKGAVNCGFITLSAPQADVLKWISGIRSHFEGEILALNISTDITKTFSLAYDFSDLIILDPDGNQGIKSMDISDMISLLDELLSLRLCYEKYTPMYLRLSPALTTGEMDALLSYCRLSGIDGIVAPGLAKVKYILEKSQGRIPVIGASTDSQEAFSMLDAGASLIELSASLPTVGRFVKALYKKTIPAK